MTKIALKQRTYAKSLWTIPVPHENSAAKTTQDSITSSEEQLGTYQSKSGLKSMHLATEFQLQLENIGKKPTVEKYNCNSMKI